MKKPFAYVIYMGRDPTPYVWLYQTLQEAEAALRSYAESMYIGVLSDDEIVETLAETGEHVHLYTVTIKGNKQTNTKLKPFARP